MPSLPRLIATAALLPVGKRAAFVQRVVAALAAGETSVLGAIAVAQRSYLSAPPVWLRSLALYLDALAPSGHFLTMRKLELWQAMTPLLSLADAELAQLIATAALLPVGKCAAFVERVAAVAGCSLVEHVGQRER